jgi:cytochrome c oxidase assembly protein subunit 15
LWNYFNLKYVNFHDKKLNFFIPFIFLILIFFQIIIGAFVSGMDAGNIYNSWPLMGSTYFPNDNEIINLFNLSAFSDPSLVQFMHRNLAYLIFIFYLYILIKIYKNKLIKFFFSINLLGLLLIIQIILGVLTLIHDAHIALASMHQISSIFLVSSSVYLLHLNSRSNQYYQS